MCLSIFSVIQCPLLPLWADSVFNSSTHIYKTAVNYQCNAGFKFDDKSNVSSKTSVCTSDKTWDPPIVQCTGEWLNLYLQYIIPHNTKNNKHMKMQLLDDG